MREREEKGIRGQTDLGLDPSPNTYLVPVGPWQVIYYMLSCLSLFSCL